MTLFKTVTGLYVGKTDGTKVVVETFGDNQDICIVFLNDGLGKFSVEEPGISQQGLTYEEAVTRVNKELDRKLPKPIPIYILSRNEFISLEVRQGEIVATSASKDCLNVKIEGKPDTIYVEKKFILPREERFLTHIAKQNRRADMMKRTQRRGELTHNWLAKEALRSLESISKADLK